MKKMLILLIVFSCFGYSRQRIGFVTGAGIGNISTNQLGNYREINLAANIGIEYQLWIFKEMSFNTGVFYVKFSEDNSAEFKGTDYFTGEYAEREENESIEIEDVSIPLYLKVNEKIVQPFLGFDIDYNIDQSLTVTVDTNGVRRSKSEEHSLGMKKTNIFYVVGCGYELSKTLAMQLKYSRGLLKLRVNSFDDETMIGERIMFSINWELMFTK